MRDTGGVTNHALRGMGHNAAATLHQLTEAARLAFTDRYAHLGDVDAVPVPLAGILSKEYAAERRRALGHRVTVKEGSFAERASASPACILVEPRDGTLRSGLDAYYPATTAGA